jgi:hypothetical protein
MHAASARQKLDEAARITRSSRVVGRKAAPRGLPAPQVRTYPGRVLPCPTCSRHVFPETSACPFCGTALRAGVAPPTAVLGLMLGVALAGCGGPSSETTGTSDTGGGTDSASSTVSSMSDPTTGVTTTTASSDSTGGTGSATGSSGSATTSTTSTTSGSDSDTTDDTTGDATTMDGTSTSTGDTTTLDTTTFDTTTSSTGDSSTGDTTEDTWDTIVLPYAGALPDDGDSL